MYNKYKHIKDMLSQLDKNYNEQKIIDDMNRDMDENHEWYESMKHVNKPKYLIERDKIELNYRKGWMINDLIYPKAGEVLVKITKIEDHIKSTLQLHTYEWRESPIVEVVRTHDNDTLPFEIGDKVIIFALKYMLRKNFLRSKRFNYNNEIYMLVFKDDILAKMEEYNGNE